MAEEKKTFVLYEYLHFFWQRKWLFIIIPVITAIVVTGAIYALKHDGKYTGTGMVYTGGVKSQDLTNDDNIKARYSKFNDLSDVFVSEKGVVKFTVKGNSQAAVQKDLHSIVNDLNQQLQVNAKVILNTSSDYMNALEARAKTLNSTLVVYNRQLNSGTLAPDEFTDVSDLIAKTNDKITETNERAYKIKGDIALFEKPKVLSESVSPSKTYIKEGIAIGIVLGLVLTVALLMLLKYLGVARKYYQHD